jgi:hypothetical protein
MKITDNKRFDIPGFIVPIFEYYDAWLVGSYLDYLLEMEPCYEDIDFFIPYKNWTDFVIFIKECKYIESIKFTDFYGLVIKFKDYPFTIDVWPDNVENLLRTIQKTNYKLKHVHNMYNLKDNILIKSRLKK